MDYRIYHCAFYEWIGCILAGVGMAAAIAGLFYRSWYAMLLFMIPCGIVCTHSYKKRQVRKRKNRLLLEFRDGMQAVSAALLAGYSMENAWKEAEKEVKKQYGVKSDMYRELGYMNAAVRVSQPLEKAVSDFAQRSDCEDIESFAEVFGFAKRSGGNYVGIIRTTVQKLSDRIEVEQEIQTVLAGKKLEGRVMDVMPLFILAYLNLTSKEFMSTLYGNQAGVIVMSAALGLYAVAIRLSEHLLDIRV
jgi:tight adherence protein B